MRRQGRQVSCTDRLQVRDLVATHGIAHPHQRPQGTTARRSVRKKRLSNMPESGAIYTVDWPCDAWHCSPAPTAPEREQGRARESGFSLPRRIREKFREAPPRDIKVAYIQGFGFCISRWMVCGREAGAPPENESYITKYTDKVYITKNASHISPRILEYEDKALGAIPRGGWCGGAKRARWLRTRSPPPICAILTHQQYNPTQCINLMVFESQIPHKIVNLFYTIAIKKNELTILWGS